MYSGSAAAAVTATKGQEMNDPGYKEETGDRGPVMSHSNWNTDIQHLAFSIWNLVLS